MVINYNDIMYIMCFILVILTLFSLISLIIYSVNITKKNNFKLENTIKYIADKYNEIEKNNLYLSSISISKILNIITIHIYKNIIDNNQIKFYKKDYNSFTIKISNYKNYKYIEFTFDLENLLNIIGCINDFDEDYIEFEINSSIIKLKEICDKIL
jgi:hypothetical protein